MSIKPQPLLEDAFNMIKCEESRKFLAQGLSSQAQITQETSALATWKLGRFEDKKVSKMVRSL